MENLNPEEQNGGQHEERQLTKKERRELRRQEKQAEKERNRRTGTAKRVVLWLIVFGAIVGGVYLLVQQEEKLEQQVAEGVPALEDTDHGKGNPDAGVVLIEYGDFQCPACRTYFPVVQQLSEELSGEVYIVYRHFPLKSIHRNAEEAARAAEAAGKQGKFWEMHDRLFESQSEWSNRRDPSEFFERLAGELGLDIAQFNADIESDDVKERVESDYNKGLSVGISSTPTFFLNGEQLQLPPSYADFVNTIRNAAVSPQPQPQSHPQ